MIPEAVAHEHGIVRTGVEHDLRRTLSEICCDRREGSRIDCLARDDAGEVLGRTDAAPPCLRRCTTGEYGKPRAADELSDAAELPCKERGTRRAHRRNPCRTAEIEHDAQDARQDVCVLMAVRVRRADARCLHAPQLCRQLRAHLCEIYRAAQDAEGERRVIVDEDARFRDE